MTERADEHLRQPRADQPGAAAPGSEVAWVGLVHRLDLEGGVWVLDTVTGDRFQLLGPVDARSGGWRLVRGRLRPELMTAAQVGPVLEVAEIREAEAEAEADPEADPDAG